MFVDFTPIDGFGVTESNFIEKLSFLKIAKRIVAVDNSGRGEHGRCEFENSVIIVPFPRECSRRK